MSGEREITVRRALAREIRSLRHRVLRAGLPIEAADFEHDDDPSTYHAAAIAGDGIVVGCATIMLSENDGKPAWRLRGMAVDEAFRRLHVGRRLLDLCERHVLGTGPMALWCNARTPAVPFYQSMGWTKHGVEFEIPTAGPHYKMGKYL